MLSIGEFRYAPIIGPDILSGILVNVTGQSVLEFAKENLFMPLGIEVEGNITFRSKEEQLEFYKKTAINGWVADPSGINTAGWGLTLTTRDRVHLGELYLNRGNWNGKQLVSNNWVEESIKEHSKWEEMQLKYGF